MIPGDSIVFGFDGFTCQVGPVDEFGALPVAMAGVNVGIVREVAAGAWVFLHPTVSSAVRHASPYDAALALCHAHLVREREDQAAAMMAAQRRERNAEFTKELNRLQRQRAITRETERVEHDD